MITDVITHQQVFFQGFWRRNGWFFHGDFRILSSKKWQVYVRTVYETVWSGSSVALTSPQCCCCIEACCPPGMVLSTTGTTCHVAPNGRERSYWHHFFVFSPWRPGIFQWITGRWTGGWFDPTKVDSLWCSKCQWIRLQGWCGWRF